MPAPLGALGDHAKIEYIKACGGVRDGRIHFKGEVSGCQREDDRVPALAIDTRDVRKRFGRSIGLDGLDLAVPEGAIFGFLGPNGAGKTTTLRVLLGLVRPDSGTIRVLGLDPSSDAPAIRRRVGVLLESDGLYDRLSAWRNLDYYARIHHVDPAQRDSRIRDALGHMRLWERRKEAVITWSRGMRQKLAIARALVHEPRLLLLDEPFAGLDPEAAADLRTQMTALSRQRGMTIFLTSHDLAHVEKVCTQVAVLRAGRVIAGGPPGLLGGRSLEESFLALMRRNDEDGRR